MKRKIKFFLRKPLIIVSILLVSLVGLTGCFRGHWHGSRHSPERMESHASEIREYLADELELRAEQKPAFEALMDGYQKTVFTWHGAWRERSTSLKEALEQPNPDLAAVRETLKRYVHDKPSDADIEALIDQTVDFYALLDAEQQEKIRRRMVKKLRRRY